MKENDDNSYVRIDLKEKGGSTAQKIVIETTKIKIFVCIIGKIIFKNIKTKNCLEKIIG